MTDLIPVFTAFLLTRDLLSQETGNERKKPSLALPQLLPSHSCTCFHLMVKQNCAVLFLC